MSKNSVSVKKLLHLDLFTRIKSDIITDERIIKMGTGEDDEDQQFRKAIARLFKEDSVIGFIGGSHNSVFFLQMIPDSTKYCIFWGLPSHLKKTKQDFALLKEFIKDQYKKASHE